PFVTRVIRQSAQRAMIQTLSVITARQRPTTYEMDAGRRRRAAYEIAMIVTDRLTHRAKVPWRRAAAMVVLRAAMIIAVVVVMALLLAAAVVIVALIGAGVQQRGGTEHQYAQAGNQ